MYSLSELAFMYKVSRKTMRKILNELKIWRSGKRFYFPKEVEIIFNTLGVPELGKEDIYFFPSKVIEKEVSVGEDKVTKGSIGQ